MTVEVVEEDGATVIELHVAEDDMGKVIGRNGSVAKAPDQASYDHGTVVTLTATPASGSVIPVPGSTRR